MRRSQKRQSINELGMNHSILVHALFYYFGRIISNIITCRENWEVRASTVTECWEQNRITQSLHHWKEVEGKRGLTAALR